MNVGSVPSNPGPWHWSRPGTLPHHGGLHPHEEVDDSLVRRAIRDELERAPGLSPTELRRRLDVGWGTLYHHLTRLVQGGVVVNVLVGGRNLLFVKGMGPVPSPRALATLKSRTARTVARCVLAAPRAAIRDLAETSGLPERTVYYHTKHLVAAGLLQPTSTARPCGLVATPALQPTLALVDSIFQEAS